MKIGVYICHCGSNIADYVDIKKVKNYIEENTDATLVKDVMFACSDSSQKEIENDIRTKNLDGIIIASCSPKLHLPTFREVAKRAGLNPYKYVHINIREQCSWAHSDDKIGATQKAIKLIEAGIRKAKYTEALESINIEAKNAVAVIGAGIAGLRAAIELADMGTYVYLIEREYFVGGRITQWDELFTTNQTGREIITNLYHQLVTYKNITLFTGAEVIETSGSVGNMKVKVKVKPRYVKRECVFSVDKFKKAVEVCPVEVEDDFNFGITKRKAIFINYPGEFPQLPAIDYEHCTKCGECLKVCDGIDLEQKPEIINLNVGAILLATGFDPYEPREGEYGYKQLSNVITLQQFKRLLELSSDELLYNGKKIKSIAYIYCVGSRQRNGENKYCSRYCCTSAMHTALLVKNKFKDISNYHFTRGIRTYGKQEHIYHEALEQGDVVFQSFNDPVCEVEQRNGNIIVKINDFLTKGKETEVEVDLVVLITGMVPRKDNKIAQLLKVPIGRDHFFNEVHLKLRPVETVIDGIFISGASQGPKNIMEAVNSALAAASKANNLVKKGYISIEPTIAYVDTRTCNWCGKCLEVCPFDAFEKVEENGKFVAKVITSLCKGCGMCLPVCEVNAIELHNYTDKQLMSLIEDLAKV